VFLFKAIGSFTDRRAMSSQPLHPANRLPNATRQISMSSSKTEGPSSNEMALVRFRSTIFKRSSTT
jgi:hypothetical protein